MAHDYMTHSPYDVKKWTATEHVLNERLSQQTLVWYYYVFPRYSPDLSTEYVQSMTNIHHDVFFPTIDLFSEYDWLLYFFSITFNESSLVKTYNHLIHIFLIIRQ